MTISAQDCLKYAIELDRMASGEKNPERHRRMLEIAKTWRQLADQSGPLAKAS